MVNTALFRELFRVLLFLILLCCAPVASNASETVHLPITLDYALIRSFLSKQLFIHPGNRAVAVDKGRGCTRIELQRPEISPETSLLKIGSRIQIKVGIPVAGTCKELTDWSGFIDVLQRIQVDQKGWNLSLKTVDARLYDLNRKQIEIPENVSNLVKTHVFPFMDKLRIDLGFPLRALKGTLPLLFSTAERARVNQWLDTARLGQVLVEKDAVRLDILMDVDTLPKAQELAGKLSPHEIEGQTKAWESWDDYLVYQIEMLVGQALSQGEATSIMERLLENRYGFVRALTEGGMSQNLVREQFVSSWQGISQILRRYLTRQPSLSPLDTLSFFTVSDAATALHRLGPGIRLNLGRDAFIRLAKTLQQGPSEPALAYSYAVNPKLRQILGLGPPLDEAAAGFTMRAITLPHLSPGNVRFPIARSRADLPVSSAFAAEEAPAGLGDVVQWVPPPGQEFFPYLEKFRKILEDEGEKTLSANNLNESYHPLYRTLLLATAWQESCWRQFTKLQEELRWLVSYNQSSVGAMQINERVWRGVYKVESLCWNISYNIRAGAEILDLYLRKYALKRMDPANPLDPDTLARVVYAMYNGGPGQFCKFLQRNEKKSFYQSDLLFFEKYCWSKEGKFNKLSLCLLGKELEKPAELPQGEPIGSSRTPGEKSDGGS